MSHLAQLQRSLQSHVIEGDLAIVAAIDSSAEIPAAIRLKIYSDAYRLRLIEALQANYPVLALLVGDELFSRITQEYLAIHPSQHYSIRWFGSGLAEFFAKFPDYREQLWLAELAEWEWKIATAFDAHDATALTMEHLAAIAPADWPELQFTPHPSLQRITLETNVVEIVRAAGNGESCPQPAKIESRAEWLIWRKDLTVQYRSLDAAEAAALDAVIGGATFSEMCEAIAEFVDAEAVPLQAVSYLQQWIADHCLVGKIQR